MSNSDKYHFNDFTLNHYKELLKLSSSKFIFTNYESYAEIDQPYLIWRHDIDFDMDQALTMAKIENELGVRSTYFILLHSEFYNLLDKRYFNKIKEIHSLGHHIGLHFDASFYNIDTQSELDDKISLEAGFLNNLLNIEIKVFSFHITNSFTMSCKNEKYGGLLNTYSSFFQNELRYCSDSNGIWRFDRLHDFLNDSNESAQVLTHPVWWTNKADSPYSKIAAFFKERSSKDWKAYNDMLRSTDRELIQD